MSRQRSNFSGPIILGCALSLGCSSSGDADSSPGNALGAGGISGGGGLGISGSGSGGASPAAGTTGAGGTTSSGGSGPGSGGAATGGAPAGDGGTSGNGGDNPGTGGGASGGAAGASSVNPIRYVFVVAMENHDGTSIYGNASAPYINGTLVANYASASNYQDPLPISIPSEPHYVWLEAGTNSFSDTTFTTDDEPSQANSTKSTEHLSTQIDAKGGLSWLAYQEGIDATSGACPIHASGYYQPKHDPFVFFQDVSGNPPSASNAGCAAHHRLLSALSGDLTQGTVASYNFVTPNQCNDMHGQFGCPSIDLIKPGDDWLAANLPGLISFCDSHDGVVLVVWDEGETSPTIPFIAVGPGVKKHYSSAVAFTHSSVVKTVERIFGLPTLATVSSAPDLGDLFLPGALP